MIIRRSDNGKTFEVASFIPFDEKAQPINGPLVIAIPAFDAAKIAEAFADSGERQGIIQFCINPPGPGTPPVTNWRLTPRDIGFLRKLGISAD